MITVVIRDSETSASAMKNEAKSTTEPIGGDPGTALRSGTSANSSAPMKLIDGHSRPRRSLITNQAAMTAARLRNHMNAITNSAKAKVPVERTAWAEKTSPPPRSLTSLGLILKNESALTKLRLIGTFLPATSAAKPKSIW